MKRLMYVGNPQLLEAGVACDEIFPTRGGSWCAVTPELCYWVLGGP